MDVYEVLFVIGFLSAMAILFYKLYNVLSVGEAYDSPGIVLTFLGYFIAWIVCFVVWMQYPETLLYANLMFLLNWLILVNTMLSIVEFMLLAKAKAGGGAIKAFNSRTTDTSAYYPGKER